ncbi:biotin--[acetyl-CoA-carboxylase] ligase [Paenibacillus thalictri]|uniref:Bifunctional ligase/repressor BirA n=1 Tax=Paenibacillus thalictri TaxID=2527873 RepID=A0A4Q9DUT5_9BACL|nr:biotin--[acetyl-CoA-carboxylase] ligase [Paenibacillus thalictri]TBL79710.1 biotin--[acetyl-CoA-carboxylase] ligase [Paenibacillus thalictri]
MNEQIIALFEQHPDQFLSGEQLSEKLNCSRTAIWKHIEILRQQGYMFEAVPRRGYRLIGRPEKLDIPSLKSMLATKTLGRTIHYVDEIDSTQTLAHQFAEQGAEEGHLVIAERQTAGRGRMGRRWHSPKGKGIWMSLLLRPRVPLHFTPQLTLLAAVALCRAIRQTVKVEAGIKWPNDLLIDGKKISGILLETSAEDERLRYIVAGIGITANLEPEHFPEELRDVATSLRIESGQPVDREVLISSFLQQFEELYELYHEQGFAPIRLLWEALSVSLHRRIRCQKGGEYVEGYAESIDDSGALSVVLHSGERIKVYSGEVELR